MEQNEIQKQLLIEIMKLDEEDGLYEEEEWVEMWDFPLYEISNKGNVRHSKRPHKNLKVRQDGNKYRTVCLYHNGKKYTKRIGRWVWMSFNKQFCSATVDHIDADTMNDKIENLQCISLQDNLDKRLKHYKKTNKYNLTEKMKGELYRDFVEGKETTWTIMKKTGIPLNYIATTMKRNSWKKYADRL